MACASSEDSDQPGHPPSLIRIFAVRMKKHWDLSHPLSSLGRLWSDWAGAQADLCLRWSFYWFCHEVAHMSYIMRKPVFAMHPCSLISAFLVRCLDSIIPVLAKSKISSLWLAPVAEQAGSSHKTPKTKSSHNKTKLIIMRPTSLFKQSWTA